MKELSISTPSVPLTSVHLPKAWIRSHFRPVNGVIPRSDPAAQDIIFFELALRTPFLRPFDSKRDAHDFRPVLERHCPEGTAERNQLPPYIFTTKRRCDACSRYRDGRTCVVVNLPMACAEMDPATTTSIPIRCLACCHAESEECTFTWGEAKGDRDRSSKGTILACVYQEISAPTTFRPSMIKLNQEIGASDWKAIPETIPEDRTHTSSQTADSPPFCSSVVGPFSEIPGSSTSHTSPTLHVLEPGDCQTHKKGWTTDRITGVNTALLPPSVSTPPKRRLSSSSASHPVPKRRHKSTETSDEAPGRNTSELVEDKDGIKSGQKSRKDDSEYSISDETNALHLPHSMREVSKDGEPIGLRLSGDHAWLDGEGADTPPKPTRTATALVAPPLTGGEHLSIGESPKLCEGNGYINNIDESPKLPPRFGANIQEALALVEKDATLRLENRQALYSPPDGNMEATVLSLVLQKTQDTDRFTLRWFNMISTHSVRLARALDPPHLFQLPTSRIPQREPPSAEMWLNLRKRLKEAGILMKSEPRYVLILGGNTQDARMMSMMLRGKDPKEWRLTQYEHPAWYSEAQIGLLSRMAWVMIPSLRVLYNNQLRYRIVLIPEMAWMDPRPLEDLDLSMIEAAIKSRGALWLDQTQSAYATAAYFMAIVGWIYYNQHHVAFSLHPLVSKAKLYDTTPHTPSVVKKLLGPLVAQCKRSDDEYENRDKWKYVNTTILRQEDESSCGTIAVHLIQSLIHREDSHLSGLEPGMLGDSDTAVTQGQVDWLRYHHGEQMLNDHEGLKRVDRQIREGVTIQ